MRVPYRNIPTYIHDTQTWTSTSFESQEAFGEFLKPLFKDCGEYGFDESTLLWNRVAKDYIKHRKQYVPNLPKGSKARIQWWENEKKKCRKGVIWKHKDKTWYIPREYYMLLNFLPITNKEKDMEETFCDVRDTQYHMGLYIMLAKVFHKHAAIVKRRQMMYSFYMVALFINTFWFEKKKVLKMFASDDAYINDVNGSWKILNAYRNFLNSKTDWIRPVNPESYPEWQQKVKYKTQTGVWVTKGNESTVVAFTLNKDAKKGIGGPCYYAWYEEAGEAPTMDTTLQYMNPALESGNEKVGLFIGGGSVGDLKNAKPLEKFVRYPDTYEMYKVPCKWFDDKGTVQDCGLFIPTQYGMPQAVDEYGNSLVEKALEILEIQEKTWALLPPDKFRLRKSQNPKTLEEAFSFREDLYFPTKLLQRRQDVISEKMNSKEINPKKGLLEEVDGKIVLVPLSKLKPAPEEHGFPVDPKQEDKRGVVTIYHEPQPNCEFLLNFAGVDTIEANKTDTSESLFSIDIVSRGVKVITTDEEGNDVISYEGGKLMATYRGRFNDIEDTNKQGELLIRLYNAFAAVERNKPNFINHMRRIGKEFHVMKRKDLTLFKDVDATGTQNDEYGIYFGSDGRAEEILNEHLLYHIQEVVDQVFKKDSNGDLTEDALKKFRRVDYIDDYWLLEELKKWYPGLNTDRRVSYGLATLAAKCYEMTYQKTVNRKEKAEKKEFKARRPINVLGGPAPRRKTKNKSRSII